MSSIHIQSSLPSGFTSLPNLFIDYYMPQANGEFVKVYIYLFRCLTNGACELKASHIADQLSCTEGDILRALRYWESQKLLSLDFSSSGELTNIALCEPSRGQSPTETRRSGQDQKIQSGKDKELSRDRIKEFMQNEDITQILYISEQYLGRLLSSVDVSCLVFFYENLHMSVDLIDYLIEYCVAHGHKSMHYIEQVAKGWSEEGITTVTMAKSAVRNRKEYYTILKALGINGRSPIDKEIGMMDIWLNRYHFPMDVIKEACSRSVMRTGQPSFAYTDSILSGWHQAGVKTLADIMPLDEEHAKAHAGKNPRPERLTQRKPAAARPQTRFHNFTQRDYDFQDYEKKLLQGVD